MTHNIIEPVEDFLAQVVCIDRLVMYQDMIQLMQLMEKGSVIEDLNLTVYANPDESPAGIEQIIHGSMIVHLKACLDEYGVVAQGGTLPFLTKVLSALHYVDTWAEHEYMYNIANTTMGEPIHILLEILNIVDYIDSEKYFEAITNVPFSLIEKIKEIHLEAMNSELDTLETDTVVSEPVRDFTLLRKIVKTNRGLVVSTLFEQGILSDPIPAKDLTELAGPYFSDMETVEPKHLALELIALYMTTGLQGAELMSVIKEEVTDLINDDALIAKMTLVLHTVYTEQTS